MDQKNIEVARIKRVLRRLDEDEQRWNGPKVAASGISEPEAALALKLIRDEKVKLNERLAELA